MKRTSKLFTLLFYTLLLLPYPSAGQHWSWCQIGANAGCEAWAIAIDPAGYIYAGGFNQYPTNSVTFGAVSVPPYATYEMFQSVWVKYAEDGTVMWAGGTSSGATSIQNMTCDASGNLIILGSFTTNTMSLGGVTLTNIYGDGSAQLFLAKYNASGTLLWVIKDGNIMPEPDLVFGIIGCGAVITDDTGNIYITSAFKKGTANFGTVTLHNDDITSNSYDIFVAKYSAAGALKWASSVGGDKDDMAFGITLAQDGSVDICGTFRSDSLKVGTYTLKNPRATSVGYMARFSSAGSPLLAAEIGNTENSYCVGLTHDSYGNEYLLGSFADTSYIFENTTYTRQFLSNSEAPAAFLMKLSPDDTVSWARIIESSFGQVLSFSLAYSRCAQQIWVSGNNSYNLLLGAPTATHDTVYSAGGADPVFIAGYDLTGDPVGSAVLPSGADDQCGVACDPAGNVYLSADFDGNEFDFNSVTIFGISSEESFYLAKYQYIVVTPDTTAEASDTSAPCNIAGMELTAPDGYTAYVWDNDSVGATRNVTTSGTYYVACISCVNVLYDTFHVTINFDTGYLHTDTAICGPTDYFHYQLTAPPGTGYVWYDDSTNPTHWQIIGGTYWVSYYSGCSYMTDTFRVTLATSVPPCPVNVGVPNTVEQSFTFYPNPAHDQVIIQQDLLLYTTCTITNAVGQIFSNVALNAGSTTMSVKSLPAGLYYFTFSGDGQSVVRKFVKE